jgi:hypothetical protein
MSPRGNAEPRAGSLLARAAADPPRQHQVPGLGDPMVFEFQKKAVPLIIEVN